MEVSMELNDHKAGLGGLDKDRINAIIREASKDSLFSKHQEKREARIGERIRRNQELIARLSKEDIHANEQKMDILAAKFESERDLTRTIVHIDMDAFYAAVEMRDDRSLRNVPMAVGGMSMLVSTLSQLDHSITAGFTLLTYDIACTSNYVARRFGVRAGMAGYIGKKLCPQLIIVPTNFVKYKAVSKHVGQILLEYDEDYMSMGLDEAYVDLTDYLRNRSTSDQSQKRDFIRRRFAGDCVCRLPMLDRPVDQASDKIECTELCENCHKQRLIVVDQVTFGLTPEDVTQEIRFRIEQETGLTASAGISVNRMLSKICTDVRKPNDQFALPPTYEDIMNFVRSLPIRKAPGIGGVSEKILKGMGIETCQDLYDKRGLVRSVFSEISSSFYLRVALGIGSLFSEDEDDDGSSDRKSLGLERTFAATDDQEKLIATCEWLCRKLSTNLQSKSLKGKLMTLKIKTVAFEVRTRAVPLNRHTSEFEPIFEAAKSALLGEIQASESGSLRLRLMGVRLSSFFRDSERLPEITRYFQAAGGNNRLVSPVRPSDDSEKDEEDGEVADADCWSDGIYELDDVDDCLLAPAAGASRQDADVETEAAEALERHSTEPVCCPVCNCRIRGGEDAGVVNAHIDRCLNRSTISALIKEQDERASDAGQQRTPAGKSSLVRRKRSSGVVGNTRRLDSYLKRGKCAEDNSH